MPAALFAHRSLSRSPRCRCISGRHKLPFLFTSTSLVTEPDSYGSMKRVGEAWLRAMRQGKVARLWNIYAPEPIRTKSHVMADWVAQCVYGGHVRSLTDGQEMRMVRGMQKLRRARDGRFFSFLPPILSPLHSFLLSPFSSVCFSFSTQPIAPLVWAR